MVLGDGSSVWSAGGDAMDARVSHEHTSGVESSEEIRSVIRRFTKAVAEGDTDAALARLSEDPGTLLIGTDPAEWWHGREARVMWRNQLERLGGSFPVTAEDVEAWEEGTVGWATVKETIDWAGESLHSRATYVLHLERGEWRIVHVHWSLPKRHVDAYGRELNITLEELERAIREERPDLSKTLAADGTVTIVFTDIVDSTVLVARLGDHAWMPVLERHNAVIETAAAEHGGTVAGTQGDGSMLAFSSARRAVSCARSIQHGMANAFAASTPPIRVRIGIHAGDAVSQADQFFGTTVNYAARVTSHALGGEILVSSVVRDLVTDPEITFLDGRDAQLKGLEGMHRLYAVDVGALP